VVQALSGGSASITASYRGFSASSSVAVRSGPPLPPDPATLATPADPTTVSSLLDEVRFLYTGPNAIQTGVAREAIEERRAAVLRGRVLSRSGNAQPGVTVTVLKHPEFGQTVSRADGYYDLVVNGGTSLTLKYERAETIPLQRIVTSLWGQQQTIDDVVLIEYDAAVTAVAMNAAQIQMARGSLSSDSDGARRATLLFPASTAASLVLPDGTLQTMPSLNIRATEFSVGAGGRLALPAALPPTSGYTYCVELSADEAVAAGATEIRFSKPVSVYVENFIGFPVGGIVPVASYDRVRGSWIASENGRVIKILAVVGGAAQIDADGNGSADSSSQLNALGITLAEQQKLASLYAPGQSLWRIAVAHFSPYDGNWPYMPPPDAESPKQPGPASVRGAERSCKLPFHSTVDCHNRTLAEEVPITGTPFSLLYDSGRVSRSQYQLDVNLTGASYPASLKAVQLRVSIAGRQFDWTFPPQPNYKFTFVWDGFDVYGRRATGMRDALVDVGYVYPGVFARPVDSSFAWASTSGAPLNISRSGLDLVIHEEWTVPLGHFDVAATGFGAWSFSAQRFFDARGHAMYDGDANRLADPLGTGRVNVRVVAGGGRNFLDDSIVATNAQVFNPHGLAPTSEGGVYVAESTRVRYVDRNGIIRTVAGSFTSGAAPDGSVAVGSSMSIHRIATGPDDSLYIAEQCRVRRVVNGLLTTVAGNGQCPTSSIVAVDGKLATTVAVNASDLAFGADGTMYLAEGSRITAVGPDGIIRKIAGLGGAAFGYGGDNGPANSGVTSANYIAVGRDGTVYFVNGVSSSQTFYIRKVGIDGIIRGVAGRIAPGQVLPIEDGADAKSGELWAAGGLSITDDGTILVTENDFPYRRVRAIAPDGKVTTVAGTGGASTTPPMNGSLARTVLLSMNTTDPAMVKYGRDGNAYISLGTNGVILKTEPLFLPSGSGEIVNPSEDGTQGYVFAAGRHVRTVDTVTGATLLSFAYDQRGCLVAVTDAIGEVTRIERDVNGSPTAIVAPGGQRTVVEVRDGVLVRVANPAGESYQFTYRDFLLASRRDPRGMLAEFTYDANGRLTRDADAAGGFISLVQSGAADDYTVERTSAEGRTFRYALQLRPDRAEERTTTDPAGLQVHSVRRDGSTITDYPDGTTETVTETADPRFGSIAPVSSAVTRLPSGKTLVTQHTRAAQLSDRNNPLSLLGSTDMWSVNGRTITSQYSGATRRGTVQSPAGRTATFELDSIGRIVSAQTAGLAPVTIAYNSRGLLADISTGTRRVVFTYNDRRELTGVRDPLSRTIGFEYDAAGRVTRQTLPDGRMIGFEYDADGNVVSITPPGRAAHRFSYTAINLSESYKAPTVAAGLTQYAYNKDRQLVSVTRPDGQVLAVTYDFAGRISAITAPNGTYSSTFDVTTGMLSSTRGPDASQIDYEYDGPLVTQVKSSGEISGTVAYSYDADFRMSSENGTSFAYDNDGLLIQAGVLTLTRNVLSGRLTATSTLGINDTYGYNDFGELTAYTATRAGQSIASATYNRDAAGRIIAEAQTSSGATVSRSFDYDSAGRLIRVWQEGAVISEYDYDLNGNRTAHRFIGGVSNATYDGQDRLLTYDDTAFTYTAGGELQSAMTGGETTTFEYDLFGNLRAVNRPGQRIQYVVDVRDRRVGKKVNGTLARGWLYGDDLRVIAELDGNGAIVKRFIYGTRANVPDVMTAAGTTYRIISDVRGSPRLIVNTSDGSIAQRLDYDEFGRVKFDSNPGFQPFGFAGGLYDTDTGLLRFGARDYDPRTGRWTTQDPIGFRGGQSNLYAYVLNDPVNSVDSSGLGNFVAGIGASFVAIIGGDAALGIAVNVDVTKNEDLGDRLLDHVGLFAGANGGIGVNASVGPFIGATRGSLANVGGDSVNASAGNALFGGTLSYSTDCELQGGQLGVGPGLPRVGSVTTGRTTVRSVRQILVRMGGTSKVRELNPAGSIQ
jgi:RHS repeat-associated protein